MATEPESRLAVGGEFGLTGLSLGEPRVLEGLTWGLDGTWTLSGRDALGIIVDYFVARGIRHFQLPAFCCESLVQPLRRPGITYDFYPVRANLTAEPDPRPDAATLLIHYFGWPNPAAWSIEEGGTEAVIHDACHAMLSRWRPPVGEMSPVLLSPRKLGAVPLGGWASVRVELPVADAESLGLVWKSLAMRFIRGNYLAHPEEPVQPRVEQLYLSGFGDLEKALERDRPIVRAPALLLDLMAGTDWKSVATARRSNWFTLHEALRGCLEPVADALPDDVVPLGYVVRVPERDLLRSRLREHRIFCPVHWPLPSDVPAGSFPEALELAESVLTIPIDQRYGHSEMERVAAIVRDLAG